MQIDFFEEMGAVEVESNKMKQDEARKLFQQKLQTKVVLSETEIQRCSKPLSKRELSKIIEKINGFRVEFNDVRNVLMNSGVAQMLLTTLSKYTGKKQESLLISDLLILHKSIIDCFPDDFRLEFPTSADHNNLKKFRKANALTFFGWSQFKLMRAYLKDLQID